MKVVTKLELGGEFHTQLPKAIQDIIPKGSKQVDAMSLSVLNQHIEGMIKQAYGLGVEEGIRRTEQRS